jgi:hypothetical protein
MKSLFLYLICAKLLVKYEWSIKVSGIIQNFQKIYEIFLKVNFKNLRYNVKYLMDEFVIFVL